MKRPTLILVMAACFAGALLLPPVARPAENPVNPLDLGGAPAEAAEFLQVHNEARARVNVPALQWSNTLARKAQSWADYLASIDKLQHSDRSQTGYGENCYGGTNGTAGTAARRWLLERNVYGGGPISVENFSGVGHYTQMVWSGTTEVGYGIARAQSGTVYVVAEYNPAGNLLGRSPY